MSIDPDAEGVFGESAGYVPCPDLAAAEPSYDDDSAAVVGHDAGYVAEDDSAAAPPANADDDVAVYGQDAGYVPKPCECPCLTVDVFDRTVPEGWGVAPIDVRTNRPGYAWNHGRRGFEEAAPGTGGRLQGDDVAIPSPYLLFPVGALAAPVEFLWKVSIPAGGPDTSNYVVGFTINTATGAPGGYVTYLDWGFNRTATLHELETVLYVDNYAVGPDTTTATVNYEDHDAWVRLRIDADNICYVRVWADGSSEPGTWTQQATMVTGIVDPPQLIQIHGGLTSNGTKYVRRFEIVEGYTCGYMSGTTLVTTHYVLDKTVNHSGDSSYETLSATGRVWQVAEQYAKSDGSFVDRPSSNASGGFMPRDEVNQIISGFLGSPVRDPDNIHLTRTFVNLSLGRNALTAFVEYDQDFSVGVATDETPFGSTLEDADPPITAAYHFNPGVSSPPGTQPAYRGPPRLMTFTPYLSTTDIIDVTGTAGVLQVAPYGLHPIPPYPLPPDDHIDGMEGRVDFRTDGRSGTYVGYDPFVIHVVSTTDPYWVPEENCT